MSLCENCISLNTCAVAMPNTEKCFFFVPTEDFRIKNSKEYAVGYEQGRVDERAKVIEIIQNISENYATKTNAMDMYEEIIEGLNNK